MKKTIIALAIAGISFNAAALSLIDNTGTANFAAEIVPTQNVLGTLAGTAKLNTLGKLDLSADVAVGDKIYVRFDLGNARFVEPVAGTGFVAANAPGLVAVANANTAIVSTGGAASDSFVVYELTAGTNAITKDAALSFGVGRLALTERGDVTITKRVYAQGDASIAKSAIPATDGVLAAKKSGTLLTFKPALTISATKGSQDISLTDAGLKFKDGVNSDKLQAKLGLLTFTAKAKNEATGAYNVDVLSVGGTVLDTAALFDVKSTVVVKGDFAGVAGKENTQLFGNATALNVATGEATFGSLNDTSPAGTNTPVQFSFTVDGKTQLSESPYTATFNLVPKNDAVGVYALPTTATVELGATKFEGNTDTLNLVIGGNSGFTQYVSLVNDGTVPATSVFFTVTDAAGQSAVVPQPDVVAKGSSQPMPVQTVFAAAKKLNPALDANSLLRIRVNTKMQGGKLAVRSYTVAKDANSVNTL